MAKRRYRGEPEEKAPESLTPEERRIQRRRERAQSRSGKGRKGFGSPLRRGLLLGIPAAAIAIVVLLLLFNPFNLASPCLNLSKPSDTPAFPPAGTTSFTGSWCPPAATPVLVVEGLLTININGSVVPLPSGMGVNQSNPTYTCTLPISTPTATQSPLPGGANFLIASPWDFSYNLSWLFGDWAATYPTVNVGPTHASHTVEYTATNLLGFQADATHRITLFVDGQPSTAGPSLVLPTLPYVSTPSPVPACVAKVYGSGHTIVLSYTGGNAKTATAGIRAATDSTGPGDPQWAPQLWDGPMPRMGPVIVRELGAGSHANARLAFLLMRPLPLAT